ncbi:MAG TPA: DUF3105 domain-containing protein [Chloroflexia bacterium]|nr:DUF3105 domain-containing protein [Chloroflexia bacterium]
MSSRAGTQAKRKQNNTAKAKRPQPAAPKTTPEQAEALALQESARREARAQRQAAARAEAARRQRTAKVRTYSLFGIGAIAVVALVAWMIMSEANKPGQSVQVMAQRNHLASATEAHTPYSTTPPTSGPHTESLPAFRIYEEQLSDEEAVHGLEDGAVIINYKPDLDEATVSKLEDIANVYLNTPGKDNIIMTPYEGLAEPVVLTTWGRIDRLEAFDEARVRTFIEAYVNIDHHEGTEGRRIP